MARQRGSKRKQRYGKMKCGGPVKRKYSTGGVVRGGGAARRGLKFSRSC